MVFVVLRSGKVLQYNSGGMITVEEGCIAIRPSNEKYLIARIPLDVVERAEFNKPCRIRRAQKMPKRGDY